MHIHYRKRQKDIKFIPRRIKNTESLKIHHKYWLQDFDSMVKVEEMFYINDDIYYTVRDLLTGRYAAISVSENSINYELLTDYNNVIGTDEIVNTRISYTGAEIKAWFFYNGQKDKFENFLPYLDYYDRIRTISDSKNYFVKGEYDKDVDKYTSARIALRRY